MLEIPRFVAHVASQAYSDLVKNLKKGFNETRRNYHCMFFMQPLNSELYFLF